MINANGVISASSSGNSQVPGLKTHFKTPEGRYKLQFEKTYPAGLLQYANTKTISQVTVANLKEKTAPSTPLVSTSSFSPISGARALASRVFGFGNGKSTVGYVGGNGGSKNGGGNGRIGSLSTFNSNPVSSTNYDGKGTYLIFNVGDTIFISDLNSQNKDPIKSIHFSNLIPVCHAFDQEAKDGHDLLFGMVSGDVYSVSLRQQLHDVGKKLVGVQHYNKEGSVNNSRCTSIAWVPGGDGAFVVAHADGNLYGYDKNKDSAVDSSFPVIKDQTQFSVAHARYSKSNPVTRWHICQGSINNIAFSRDGAYLASVGRDGFLRVFDYSKEHLVCGGKSYYGALLCCSWSGDGKYVLSGGEDDLILVWSMEDRKVVACGEGHSSWVSGVAFDSFWSPPSSDGGARESVIYRLGSVGQDTQLLLWDLEMDEIVVPLRRCPPGGSSPSSVGNQSSHWDSTTPIGALQPPLSIRDIPKLSPMVLHRVSTEPLSGLIFTRDSILTVCRDGNIKVWIRPVIAEKIPSLTEPDDLCTSLKERALLSNKPSSSAHPHPHPLR